MSKFIELKDACYRTGVLVNTDIIDFVINTGNGARLVLSQPLHGTEMREVQTFEYSYDELKEMLTDKCHYDKKKEH